MRRITILWVLVPVIVLAVGQAVGKDTKLTVTADRVNLRAAPSDQVEVVMQVSEGDTLVTKTGIKGDWVAILPPDSVGLWVYGQLVRNGVVAVSKLLVRSGPGINYKSVGSLAKGRKVLVRATQGDWLKIAPPAETRLWVSAKYVRPAVPPPKPVAAVTKVASVSVPAKKLAAKPKPVAKPPKPVVAKQKPKPKPPVRTAKVAVTPPRPPPEQKPVAPVSVGTRSSKLPHVLADCKLVPSAEQGKIVEYHGVLRRAGLVWRLPSRYRLVERDRRGRAVTACYVLWREYRLASVVGLPIGVYGREYWLQGVRHPVVIPDKIVRER